MIFELSVDIVQILFPLLVLNSKSLLHSGPTTVDIAKTIFIDFLLVLKSLHFRIL